MKQAKVVITLILSTILFLSVNAQNAQPTLKETLDWIKSKINAYGGDLIQSEEKKVYVDEYYNVVVYTNRSYYTGSSDDEGGETLKLSLYDVTSFYMQSDPKTMGDANYVLLRSKNKQVSITNKSKDYNGNWKNDTKTAADMPVPINFNTDSYTTAEENIRERFRKALQTLVNYNIKDMPKEAF